jgi:hypothetical protein
VEEHARVKVGYDFVEAEGWLGVEGRNDTERGNDLEVLITFVDEGQVGTLGADTEVLKGVLAIIKTTVVGILTV